MRCNDTIDEESRSTKTRTSLAIVISMYREIVEVKSSLRGCLDFCRHGYAEDYDINILVVIDGCTTSNDRTLQSLQLEIKSYSDPKDGLGEPQCNKEFGCLVYNTMYAGIPIEILIKGSNVKKGKRFSQILAFDYISSKAFLPHVVIMQDCDTYMPAYQMSLNIKKSAEKLTIVCPQICLYSNIFYDGLLAFAKANEETRIRYWRGAMQRIGCCPLMPGPLVIYSYDSLRQLMVLYSQDIHNNIDLDVFFGNKMLVEDCFMGWCATAAGLVPNIEFHRSHAYWNLPGRLFPLLRQRRRWIAGKVATAVVGHQQLEMVKWKAMVMKSFEIFNIFNVLILYTGMILYIIWTLVVDHFGKNYLFLFASPMLRVLLSPCISAKNDGWFMLWVCIDSLTPWVFLIWAMPPISTLVGWWFFVVCLVLYLSMAALIFYKHGFGTAATISIDILLRPLLFEQQQFEMDYAMVMFHDIAWGNREVTSSQQPSKLDIKCTTKPSEKAWAGSSQLAFKKTFGSYLLTASPFIYRLLLFVVIWFHFLPLDICLPILVIFPLIMYIAGFFELLFAPNMKYERSYKAGSAIKLPGPILKYVDLDMCKDALDKKE